MGKEIIAAFGEVMVRLAPEGKNRLAQVVPGILKATFGGGEANVCVSLAVLGAPARYLTALPENPVAAAFAAQLRGLGVDVDHILWTQTGRMGIYYVEHGAAQRPSKRLPRSRRRIMISPPCFGIAEISTSPALRLPWAKMLSSPP